MDLERGTFMIAIIDYGAGNLKSVYHALQELGYESKVTSDKEELYLADALILPGVGAFKDAMLQLNRLQLADTIKEVVQYGKPILGICLGMQLFYEKSYENGEWDGLSLLEGEIVRFDHHLKVPHMGWNKIIRESTGTVTDPSLNNEYVYFVHSYYVKPKREEEVLYWTDYGIKFPAAVKKGNIIGMQFHPEKSGDAGMELLKSFGELVK